MIHVVVILRRMIKAPAVARHTIRISIRTHGDVAPVVEAYRKLFIELMNNSREQIMETIHASGHIYL